MEEDFLLQTNLIFYRQMFQVILVLTNFWQILLSEGKERDKEKYCTNLSSALIFMLKMCKNCGLLINIAVYPLVG